jgi:NADPH:quinone reductase
MRAAICSSHGPPEVVAVGDMPSPQPGPSEVRVRVRAAAINFPDVLVIADRYQLKVPAPFVPGSEFAGVVDAVGADVRGFAVGDRVFGAALVGAFAEQIVVPASVLTPTPPEVGEDAAAAFGVAHRTAFHVLRSVACVGAGDDLVVLGAGSGVGLAAVQLGALLDASVTAVASTAVKLEVAAACGARHLVNHRDGDVRQSLRHLLPGGATAVVDPVGGTLSEPALRSLRWGGRFVTVGYAAGEIPRIPLNLVLLKGVHVLGFEFGAFVTHAAADAERNERELLELFAGGRVTPHIGARFPLDDVATALRSVADGRAIGKVVLDVG